MRSTLVPSQSLWGASSSSSPKETAWGVLLGDLSLTSALQTSASRFQHPVLAACLQCPQGLARLTWCPWNVTHKNTQPFSHWHTESHIVGAPSLGAA